MINRWKILAGIRTRSYPGSFGLETFREEKTYVFFIIDKKREREYLYFFKFSIISILLCRE